MKTVFFISQQLQHEIERHLSADHVEINFGKDENLDKPYYLELNDCSYFYYLPEHRDSDLKDFKIINNKFRNENGNHL